jgi:hypothetical protein
VGGDWNAKNAIWGSHPDSGKGMALGELVWTIAARTSERRTSNTNHDTHPKCAINITLTMVNLMNKSTWTVQKNNLGSNHKVIAITIDGFPKTQLDNRRKSINKKMMNAQLNSVHTADFISKMYVYEET